MICGYKNINSYNPYKENKILIVFDDMIGDMIHDKKLDSTVTELFIRGRKLNISLAFIMQSYFEVLDWIPLTILLPDKRRLWEISINHSLDISTKDFTNIYRKCTTEPFSFLANDTTLASDNPLRSRKSFLEYNKNHGN